jgi:hypothetical protein
VGLIFFVYGYFALGYLVHVPQNLEHVAVVCLRFVFALVGMTLLYMAMFMYEDDRGKQQNLLVNLWVKVKEREEESLGRQATVLRFAAQIASSGMNRTLGDQIWSIWSLVVSVSLSLSSVYFVFFVLIVMGQSGYSKQSEIKFLCTAIVYFAYGLYLAPRIFRSGKRLHKVLGIVFLCIIVIGASGWIDSNSFGGFVMSISGLRAGLWELVPIVGFGAACDVLIIALNRKIIRIMANSASRAWLFFAFVSNLVCCLFIGYTTIRFARVFISGFGDPFVVWLCHLMNIGTRGGRLKVTEMLSGAASTNLFTMLVVSSFLLVTVAALMHRLLWPIVGRSLNALYEWEILKSRTTQFTLGIGCLVFAIPQLGAILKQFKT